MDSNFNNTVVYISDSDDDVIIVDDVINLDSPERRNPVNIEQGVYELHPVQTNADEDSIFKIENVLREDSLNLLKQDVENIPLETVESDLSHFNQSRDLYRIQEELPEAFCNFMVFLKTIVKPTVEKTLNLKLKEDLTLTISLYKKGDYLLCHDDRLNTRSVAFVYYVNSLMPEDGGTLRFFSHTLENDPVPGEYITNLAPQANTLVFFRVDERSHHEVEQIFGDETKRITINGWFHHPQDEDDVIYVKHLYKAPVLTLEMPVGPILSPNKIIAPVFLSHEGIRSLKHHLTQTSQTLLVRNALQEDFYENCQVEFLDSSEDNWQVKGPANCRSYETLPYEVEGPHLSFGESYFHINNLVDFLLSPRFLDILQKITGVEYAVFKPTDKPPTCMLEVQRWKEGSYSLLSDNMIENQMPTMDITVYFKVNKKIVGSANNEEDMSGVCIQTIKPGRLSKKNYKKLHGIKWRRLRMKCEPLKRRLTIRQQESMVKKLNIIVKDKLENLARYRSRRAPDVQFIVPQDNSIILTFSTRQCAKYTSYIRKRDINSSKFAYYAVSVSYFTA